jgi:hypothetical protein
MAETVARREPAGPRGAAPESESRAVPDSIARLGSLAASLSLLVALSLLVPSVAVVAFAAFIAFAVVVDFAAVVAELVSRPGLDCGRISVISIAIGHAAFSVSRTSHTAAREGTPGCAEPVAVAVSPRTK